jgi:hypothetical protein
VCKIGLKECSVKMTEAVGAIVSAGLWHAHIAQFIGARDVLRTYVLTDISAIAGRIFVNVLF